MIKMPPKKKNSADSSTPTDDSQRLDEQPSPTTAKKKYEEINNRQVDDIQLEFFYKPHTISCLLACLALLIYMAFSRDTSDYRSNVWAGLGSMFIYFMVISILVIRILTNGLMGAPAARQYYTYVTDRTCKRLGSQVWVFIFISLSELVLNLKFGQELFSQTQMSKILIWLMLNVLIAVAGTYASMKIYNWRFPPPPPTPSTEQSKPFTDTITEELQTKSSRPKAD